MSTALFNYIPRTNDILKACHHDYRCPDDHLQRIATTKKLNVGMSVITIGIELVIGYLIFNTIGKY